MVLVLQHAFPTEFKSDISIYFDLHTWNYCFSAFWFHTHIRKLLLYASNFGKWSLMYLSGDCLCHVSNITSTNHFQHMIFRPLWVPKKPGVFIYLSWFAPNPDLANNTTALQSFISMVRFSKWQSFNYFLNNFAVSVYS